MRRHHNQIAVYRGSFLENLVVDAALPYHNRNPRRLDAKRPRSSPAKPFAPKIWRISSRSPSGISAIDLQHALIIVPIRPGSAVVARCHGNRRR
jgi:hypothetical protein